MKAKNQSQDARNQSGQTCVEQTNGKAQPTKHTESNNLGERTNPLVVCGSKKSVRPDTSTLPSKLRLDGKGLRSTRSLSEDKTAEKPLSDKKEYYGIYMYEGKEGYFWENDVKQTLAKVMEKERIYWECNECHLLYLIDSDQKICYCGNDMKSNSTKRKFIRSDDIKDNFGEELMK